MLARNGENFLDSFFEFPYGSERLSMDFYGFMLVFCRFSAWVYLCLLRGVFHLHGHSGSLVFQTSLVCDFCFGESIPKTMEILRKHMVVGQKKVPPGKKMEKEKRTTNVVFWRFLFEPNPHRPKLGSLKHGVALGLCRFCHGHT